MRILTLSDIHYKVEYDENQFVISYLKSFKDKIEEIHKSQAIDAVFICGDLSFSGESEQYKRLGTVIRQALPRPLPIFSIVGNHDVSWVHLKEAIGKKKSLENLFSFTEDEISSELKTKNSKFKNVFKEFRINFNEDINKGLESKFEFKFCDKSYSGYVWFSEHKLLFILLNSSWYSFGPGVIKHYYDEMIDEWDAPKLKEQLYKYIGDAYSQVGKQSYFFSSFPYSKEITDIIEKDSDVRVINFAHHPPSWLKWDEQFLSESNKRNFNELINITDLLVTGHLHNPIQPPALLQNRCFHISNGAFLDYHFIDNDEQVTVDPYKVFPENWFNIIDINMKSFNYESFKFKTRLSRSLSYDYFWESIISTSPNKYDFSKVAIPNKRPLITTEFKEGSIDYFIPNNLIHVISLLEDKRKNNFPKDLQIRTEFVVDSVNILKSKNEDYLIIINDLDKVYETLDSAGEFIELSDNKFFKSLIDTLESYDPSSLPVLAFYDFLRTTDDVVIFSKFQNERFILFQSFKHKFFSKFKELFKFTELCIIYDSIIE